MGSELDLMRLYPKPKNRMTERPEITDEDREISRRFGFDYFDGDRRHGYGGFGYHPRFWTDTVDLFTTHYGLSDDSAILDVGCGKGFMLKDFSLRLPGAALAGVDIGLLHVVALLDAPRTAGHLPNVHDRLHARPVGEDDLLVGHHFEEDAAIGKLLTFRALHDDERLAAGADVELGLGDGPGLGAEPLHQQGWLGPAAPDLSDRGRNNALQDQVEMGHGAHGGVPIGQV